MDRPTWFIIAGSFGSSENEAAPSVVATTRERTAGRKGAPWVRDGRKVYRQEVRRTYRDLQRTGQRGRPPLVVTPGIGLSPAVKRRRRGRGVRMEVRQVMGDPIAIPYTVHEERFHRVLRDRLGCLTRKTHAFAKDART